MKSKNAWVYKAIEKAAIEKVKTYLKKQQFNVFTNHELADKQNKRTDVDLFAEKDGDHRIYEIQLTNKMMPNQRYDQLQNLAKDNSAELYILFVEIPQGKKIKIDELPNILLKAINKRNKLKKDGGNFDGVDVLDIYSLAVKDKMIDVKGVGIATKKYQNGNEDQKEFTFKLSYNVSETENNVKSFKCIWGTII